MNKQQFFKKLKTNYSIQMLDNIYCLFFHEDAHSLGTYIDLEKQIVRSCISSNFTLNTDECEYLKLLLDS